MDLEFEVLNEGEKFTYGHVNWIWTKESECDKGNATSVQVATRWHRFKPSDLVKWQEWY